MKQKRDAQFSIRLSRTEKLALDRVALDRVTTPSQLIRQALKLVLAGAGGRTR